MNLFQPFQIFICFCHFIFKVCVQSVPSNSIIITSKILQPLQTQLHYMTWRPWLLNCAVCSRRKEVTVKKRRRSKENMDKSVSKKSKSSRKQKRKHKKRRKGKYIFNANPASKHFQDMELLEKHFIVCLCLTWTCFCGGVLYSC